MYIRLDIAKAKKGLRRAGGGRGRAALPVTQRRSSSGKRSKSRPDNHKGQENHPTEGFHALTVLKERRRGAGITSRRTPKAGPWPADNPSKPECVISKGLEEEILGQLEGGKRRH